MKQRKQPKNRSKNSVPNRRLLFERLESRECPAFFASLTASGVLLFNGTTRDDKLLNIFINPSGTISYTTADNLNPTPWTRDSRISAPTAAQPMQIKIVGNKGKDLVDLTTNLPGF